MAHLHRMLNARGSNALTRVDLRGSGRFRVFRLRTTASLLFPALFWSGHFLLKALQRLGDLQVIQEDYRRGLEVLDFTNENDTSAERCNALA